MPRQFKLLRRDEYAIDTSALVRLEERKDSSAIWPRFFQLIDDERVKTVRFVTDELLRHSASAANRLRPYHTKFIFPELDALVSAATRLINLYPKMSRPRSERTVADPWVIALAQVDKMSVVTCELSNAKANHIPDVCQSEGVKCLDLQGFLKIEKLFR